MTQHALVLLGLRHSGKDTLALQFTERFGERVRNCKFSELTKSLVAAAFAVPRADLEDKLLRTLPVNPALMGDLTTLDLLDALFHASALNRPSCRRLRQANIKFAVERAKQTAAELLIFTDVRRVEEAKAVLQSFSYTAVHIHRRGEDKANDTDREIADASDLLDALHLRIPEGESPEATYERLQTLLQEKGEFYP